MEYAYIYLILAILSKKQNFILFYFLKCEYVYTIGVTYEPETCEKLSHNLKHKIKQNFRNNELRRFTTDECVEFIDDDDLDFIICQVSCNLCVIYYILYISIS